MNAWLKTLLVLATSTSSLASGLGLERGTFTPRPLGTTASAQAYLEYLPVGYGVGKRSPLIVFLSGRGQSGKGDLASLDNLSNFAIPEEMKLGRWPEERPFVVLTPQHVEYETCPNADEIDAFIQFAKANYQIDTDRIYLAGASCGAHGLAAYLAKYANKDVAAAAPFGGNLWPAWEAQRCNLVRSVALFGVHGGRDDRVPIEPDAAAFRKFSACSNRRDVSWVVYEEAGHADPIIWMYRHTADYDVFAWMLGFTKAPYHVRVGDASAAESAPTEPR